MPAVRRRPSRTPATRSPNGASSAVVTSSPPGSHRQVTVDGPTSPESSVPGATTKGPYDVKSEVATPASPSGSSTHSPSSTRVGRKVPVTRTVTGSASRSTRSVRARVSPVPAPSASAAATGRATSSVPLPGPTSSPGAVGQAPLTSSARPVRSSRSASRARSVSARPPMPREVTVPVRVTTASGPPAATASRTRRSTSASSPGRRPAVMEADRASPATSRVVRTLASAIAAESSWRVATTTIDMSTEVATATSATGWVSRRRRSSVPTPTLPSRIPARPTGPP